MLNYCRLCLKNETLITDLITTEMKYSHLNIFEFLYWIFDVEVTISDAYSKLICQRCTNILREVERYRDTFKKAQLILREKIDDLDSTCTNEVNNLVLCDRLIKDETRRPLLEESQNISIPIINITRLENSTVLKKYEKIGDLSYKKKDIVNKDSDNWLAKSRSIGTLTKEEENGTIRVPIEVFETCICPSLSICKLEDDTIYHEYEKVDNTTYKKIPCKFDVNPNQMRSEIKRMKFIEYYYKTPTTALQELIKKKYEADAQKNNVIKKQSVTASCENEYESEALIKIHEVHHVHVCNYCSKSFTSKKLLIMHRKKQHKTIRRGVQKNKKCKLRKTQNLTNNINNSLRSNEFLTKLKCKWNNITDLINIRKRKETIAPNSDLFPNLQFVKEQNKNGELRKNVDSDINESVHKADENIHINLETEKKAIENNTEIVCTLMPHAKSTENQKKDISIIQHILIQKNVLRQDLENIEENDSQMQCNENMILHCQQKNTFSEIKQNGSPTTKDNKSVDKRIEGQVYSSKLQNLESLQIAEYLWEKTVNDIRVIQESESEDKKYENHEQTKSPNLMDYSQRGIEKDIIHNINPVSEDETFVNEEKNLQFMFPTQSHTLESQIKNNTIGNIGHPKDRSKQIQVERQENMPNFVVNKEQNNENALQPKYELIKIIENENHAKEVENFIDDEENNVFFFNKKGELDKGIQHNFNKIQEYKNNTNIKSKQIIGHSQLQDLQSLLKKKDIINKLKKHMQKNMTEQECDSQNATICRDDTVKAIDMLATDNEGTINLLESIVKEDSISECGKEFNLPNKNSVERPVEMDNNSVQSQLSISPKISCKSPESRIITNSMQINSDEKLMVSKKLRLQSPKKANHLSKRNGFEVINKNGRSNYKRIKLSKQIKTYRKRTIDSSKELRNCKLLNIHDGGLDNVSVVKKTNVKVHSGSKEDMQPPETKSSSKSRIKRKNKSRNSQALCPQVDKKLSILFERMNISGNNPITNSVNVTEDHSYATKICNKYGCKKRIMKASRTKKLRCNIRASLTLISGRVGDMKELCKPCTVVAEKLDITQKIPGIHIINVCL